MRKTLITSAGAALFALAACSGGANEEAADGDVAVVEDDNDAPAPEADSDAPEPESDHDESVPHDH